MIIRSRAPLRIGLAGGGTDLESYSNQYGGAVLNATIAMYAYCTIIPTTDNTIKIYSYDNKHQIETASTPILPIDGDNLILHRGVYNRIVKDFNNGKPLSFIMSTSNDAPIGSGLGTSSTMVVAILEAFNKWLNLNLTNYQKAQLAYDIERKDLNLMGGKQDQFAAVFGGFNYMTFNTDGTTNVYPLVLDRNKIHELESSLILYYGGISRKSADIQLALTNNIISHQISNTQKKEDTTINAMQALTKTAAEMRDYVLKGDLKAFANCLRIGWENKKKTSSIVSNFYLEQIIDIAMHNGAEAVKVSGAGGGGFLMLYFKPENRHTLTDTLFELQGRIYPVKFVQHGAESWVANE